MAQPKSQLFWTLSATLTLLACSQDQAPMEQPEAPVASPQKLSEAPADHTHAPAEAAPEMPAVPAGAKVWFVSPQVAARVEGPLVDGKVEVPVVMGAEGIEVKPAGALEAGAGHHHVLIDLSPILEGTTIVKDDSHIHFGGGQTEATVPVMPGHHTLTLQFADGLHRSYGSALSSSVTIEVVAGKKAAAK